MEGKVASLIDRIIFVRFLAAARKYYKLGYLADASGVDASLLSRYTTGRMLPSGDALDRIRDRIRSAVNVGNIILDEAVGPNWVLDLSQPLMKKEVLDLAAIELYWRTKNWSIDKILVPETSGVSLATRLGHYLNVDVVIARKRKTNPALKWIEEHVTAPPNISRSLYLPVSVLDRGERVLIVDDFIRSGYTLTCAARLIEKADAVPVGVASLVVFGNEWRRLIDFEKIEALVWLDSNSSLQRGGLAPMGQ
jgi:adenine/guanine phosphoribosyltransferase-like PRPP-binding protein